VIAAVVVAAVGGGAVGVATTLLVVRRRSRHQQDVAAATPAAATAPRWSDVVDRLSLGVVVSGSSGLVHYRNRADVLKLPAVGQLRPVLDDLVAMLSATQYD